MITKMMMEYIVDYDDYPDNVNDKKNNFHVRNCTYISIIIYMIVIIYYHTVANKKKEIYINKKTNKPKNMVL